MARRFAEIRTEFQDIRVEMKEVYCQVTESSEAAEEKMALMKGLMGETFDIVMDSRFKVQYSVGPFAWFSFCVIFDIKCIFFPQDGLEGVDAAYTVFLRYGFEDLQLYIIKLRCNAVKSLNPQRVREYLKIIFEKKGLHSCQVWYIMTIFMLK